MIRVFACLAPLLSNFCAASRHLSFSISVCTFLPVDHVPIREFSNGGLLLWDELLEDFTLLCDTGVGWGLSLSLFFSFFVSGFSLQCMRWSFEARVGLNGALFCSSSAASGACGKLPPHCIADDEEERYC